MFTSITALLILCGCPGNKVKCCEIKMISKEHFFSCENIFVSATNPKDINKNFKSNLEVQG